MTKRYILWGGVAALTFLFVWQQIQSVRLGYEVEKARTSIEDQKRRNAYLKLEIERQMAPAEISRLARERLKMSAPAPGAIVVLDTGRTQDAAAASPARLARWPKAALRTTRNWLLAARPRPERAAP
ncbi:MAG: cell division protein FtsL [Elusimicrobia bacterium]|nr:cell division protein FtsL [Elusimicrobiota bacterium]